MCADQKAGGVQSHCNATPHAPALAPVKRMRLAEASALRCSAATAASCHCSELRSPPRNERSRCEGRGQRAERSCAQSRERKGGEEEEEWERVRNGRGPSEGWLVCTRAYRCRAAQSSRDSSAPGGGYRPLLKCSPSSLPADSRPSNASSLATSHSPAQPRASERASKRARCGCAASGMWMDRCGRCTL